MALDVDVGRRRTTLGIRWLDTTHHPPSSLVAAELAGAGDRGHLTRFDIDAADGVVAAVRHVDVALEEATALRVVERRLIDPAIGPTADPGARAQRDLPVHLAQ